MEEGPRITVAPEQIDLSCHPHLGHAEWEWVAKDLIRAAQKKGYWIPLKQKVLTLNKNIIWEHPGQPLAEMIIAGWLVYTQDGYWPTPKLINRILENQQAWQKQRKEQR